MLYKKNQSKQLDPALFKSPTAEYRGTPFWAWNDKLDKEDLLWQIEELKRMGFGGFHMHSRAGMATHYLSEEFMDLVKACTDKAKEEGMLSYLYDEDRWPSGAAGGFVTKNKKYRKKTLQLTVERQADAEEGTVLLSAADDLNARMPLIEACAAEGKPYLLAAFDVVLDEEGYLLRGDMISPDATAEGTKWYAYVYAAGGSGWHNNQAYADTLSEEAVAEFIRITYNAYERAVGEEFGQTVPSIFTDEPQFARADPLPFATSLQTVKLPWTTDLPLTFAKAYGFDLIPSLPRIFWDVKGEPSRARYCFRDHVCERFTCAFGDQCGKWCAEHGIALTGHVLEEPTLKSQTYAVGEAMRCYRNFGLPGIDMLCDWIELSTAKQCQSAVHQYGREGMLSELYGVTGWAFDFRGHKFQGDWQAALGVTVRVPHLSWVSMKGSAKRDYPASISYQSAWYREYPYIEDHFARLNTALTRGTPRVRVGVIHPIESYWLAFGPSESTAAKRQELEENFENVIKWLLGGQIDFDFISESLLPEQYAPSDDGKLHVGEMAYSAILLPGPDTIRSTTVQILEAFAKQGGKLVVAGNPPKYVDAAISDGGVRLAALGERVSLTSVGILDALESQRDLRILTDKGTPCTDYIYQMRQDGAVQWLFVARVARPPVEGDNKDDADSPKTLILRLKGKKKPTLYDTLTGEICPVAYEIRGNMTEIPYTFYPSDSLLLCLEEATEGKYVAERVEKKPTYTLDLRRKMPFSLAEPNVLVLDMPEWAEEGGEWQPREEIMRLDRAIRLKYGLPKADGGDVQPWVLNEQKPAMHIRLRFAFQSSVAVPCRLAFEEAREILFNGESVPIVKDGYFTDKRIYTTKLPNIKKGRNVLEILAPLGKRTSLENYFLLGEFGVRTEGTEARVTALSRTLAFGDITDKGLPFYGAGLTYRIPLDIEKESNLAVAVEHYKGALVGVRLDGAEAGKIVFAPYRLTLPDLKPGHHVLELTVYLTRVNSFGSLHCIGNVRWKGPNWWYVKGKDFAYEYQLYPNGILKAPVVEIYEK